jgi:hypothetical protein
VYGLISLLQHVVKYELSAEKLFESKIYSFFCNKLIRNIDLLNNV